MSYLTYTTDAFVCGHFDRYTADRSFVLFTREAGLIRATARSVRTERSRQRFALQDFSLVRVSLIRGKNSWRVGSVTALQNYYHAADTREKRGSVVSLFRLIGRFVRGEEPAPELFDYFHESLSVLIEPIAHRDFIEKCLELHLLSLLGYVNTGDVPKMVNLKHPRSLPSLYTKENEAIIHALYEQGIAASQL